MNNYSNMDILRSSLNGIPPNFLLYVFKNVYYLFLSIEWVPILFLSSFIKLPLIHGFIQCNSWGRLNRKIQNFTRSTKLTRTLKKKCKLNYIPKWNKASFR